MSIVYVLPIDDLRAHEERSTCWCEPRIVDLGEEEGETGNAAKVIVYASADGRERHERQN